MHVAGPENMPGTPCDIFPGEDNKELTVHRHQCEVDLGMGTAMERAALEQQERIRCFDSQQLRMADQLEYQAVDLSGIPARPLGLLMADECLPNILPEAVAVDQLTQREQIHNDVTIAPTPTNERFRIIRM